MNFTPVSFPRMAGLGNVGDISLYDSLPSNVKQAVYKIASDLGDTSTLLLNQIATDYLINDVATVNQVNTYIAGGNVVQSSGGKNATILLVVVGVILGWQVGKKFFKAA